MPEPTTPLTPEEIAALLHDIFQRWPQRCGGTHLMGYGDCQVVAGQLVAAGATLDAIRQPEATPPADLAGLLHAVVIDTGWGSCVHSPENEWRPFCEETAARLQVAGVGLSAHHAITPECGPICWTTGHHHDVEACDGCRRLADIFHAAGVRVTGEAELREALPDHDEGVDCRRYHQPGAFYHHAYVLRGAICTYRGDNRGWCVAHDAEWRIDRASCNAADQATPEAPNAE